MVKATKTAKTTSGVGFAYGGVLKTKYEILFKFDDSFDECYEKLKTTYGSNIQGRYAISSEPDVHLDKIRSECKDEKFGQDIYFIPVTQMSNVIKKITEAKKLTHFGVEKCPTTKSKSKKQPDSDSDDEKNPQKAPQKKQKDDSDSDDDASKITVTKVTKKQAKYTDSDSDSDDQKKPKKGKIDDKKAKKDETTNVAKVDKKAKKSSKSDTEDSDSDSDSYDDD